MLLNDEILTNRTLTKGRLRDSSKYQQTSSKILTCKVTKICITVLHYMQQIMNNYKLFSVVVV